MALIGGNMNAELIMGKFNSSSSSSIWYKGQRAQEGCFILS